MTKKPSLVILPLLLPLKARQLHQLHQPRLARLARLVPDKPQDNPLHPARQRSMNLVLHPSFSLLQKLNKLEVKSSRRSP